MAHRSPVGCIIRFGTPVPSGALTWGFPCHCSKNSKRSNDSRLSGTHRSPAFSSQVALLPGAGFRGLVSSKESDRGNPVSPLSGAGIAGLNCALTLADKGLRPSVYEALGTHWWAGPFSNNQGYWSDCQATLRCGGV